MAGMKHWLSLCEGHLLGVIQYRIVDLLVWNCHHISHHLFIILFPISYFLFEGNNYQCKVGPHIKLTILPYLAHYE